MHIYSQYLLRYNQSPLLKKITSSAFIIGGTVLQQITRFYFRSRVISYLYISSGWTNALVRERIHYPFHLLKHYIQLSIFSFVRIPFLSEPVELHYRLISNRSFPSFTLGTVPTMTLQLHADWRMK